MKTMDELPERINPSQFRNGLPQSPWDQGPTSVASVGNKSGNAASPVPSQPGGEKISKAELADYSNRSDRDYAGAGRAAMPPVWDPISMPLPRQSSGGSWSTQGAGGGDEPHPTSVTEWKGGMKPEKP